MGVDRGRIICRPLLPEGDTKTVICEYLKPPVKASNVCIVNCKFALLFSRGGKICLTDHFKPLWARNVPRFGIAHAMALGVRKKFTIMEDKMNKFHV